MTTQDLSNFILVIGPITLYKCLPTSYYMHFLLLRQIVLRIMIHLAPRHSPGGWHQIWMDQGCDITKPAWPGNSTNWLRDALFIPWDGHPESDGTPAVQTYCSQVERLFSCILGNQDHFIPLVHYARLKPVNPYGKAVGSLGVFWAGSG
ncbi:hypothetical protein JCM1840_005113 [Sporobolomyces johnsonii]